MIGLAVIEAVRTLSPDCHISVMARYPQQVDLTPIWYREVGLIGLYAHGMEEWNGVRQSTYDRTTDLLLKKKLCIDGLITHRFPLKQWCTAVRTAKDKRSGAIKVVLDYREAGVRS